MDQIFNRVPENGQEWKICVTSKRYDFQDHSEERLKQLKFCFKYLADEDPSEVNVIFGGDLNLRDKELNELGGPPYAVQVV